MISVGRGEIKITAHFSRTISTFFSLLTFPSAAAVGMIDHRHRLQLILIQCSEMPLNVLLQLHCRDNHLLDSCLPTDGVALAQSFRQFCPKH